ncbi:FtsK/SpoIIIE domain-containing protein [Endothiovibrio diazotrophicus]
MSIQLIEKQLKKTEALIAETQNEIRRVSERLNTRKSEALNLITELRDKEIKYFNWHLGENAAQIIKLNNSLPPFLLGYWDEKRWHAYDFDSGAPTSYLVIGEREESEISSSPEFRLPAYLPFIGKQRTAIIEGNAEDSLDFFRALVLRIATIFPHQCHFSLLDPAGQGRAFPLQNKLPMVRSSSGQLFQDLESILDDIGRIIQTYLDDNVKSFEQLSETIRNNERFEFIFAANFPDGYDRRSIEALQKISRNGPAAGKYLFIHRNSDVDLPRDIAMEGFSNVFSINPVRPSQENGWKTRFMNRPEAALQQVILEGLLKSKPRDHVIRWEEIAENDSSLWWRGQSDKLISCPIGYSGADRYLNVWFGTGNEGRPCAHGLLGAMPGSGKSNLYHVLICGLAIRYSPEELSLYLVDGKNGVEFQSYRTLPHAHVVSLHSSPELSRSVLRELLDEMDRRNDKFKRAGVVDLTQYREAGQPLGNLPRILLVADEYQEFFEDDRDGIASTFLLQLAQQGRSSGIHMLLGSQRFNVTGMLHQAAIFGSIHLRMAMKMSQADIQGLSEFGRAGKQLISTCDLPGKIVLNDQSGEDSANNIGKIVYLDKEKRDALVIQLGNKYSSDVSDILPENRRPTIVFDGAEQPNFTLNPQVRQLCSRLHRPTSDQWQEVAKRSMAENGLEVDDWFSGEAPIALWLGQEFNIHGHARLILRRRPMENVIIAGESKPAHYGMIASILFSIALNLNKSNYRLYVVDRSTPSTPWHETIEKIINGLTASGSINSQFSRDTGQAALFLDQLIDELDKRKQLPEHELIDQPTLFMVLTDADSWQALNKVAGQYGTQQLSPAGEKLSRLCSEGPVRGIHLITTVGSATMIDHLFDRGKFEQTFKHRIALQMSEDDSFFFLKGRDASTLQAKGSSPLVASYVDLLGGKKARFKPYVSNPQIPLDEQLKDISSTLSSWELANVQP